MLRLSNVLFLQTFLSPELFRVGIANDASMASKVCEVDTDGSCHEHSGDKSAEAASTGTDNHAYGEKNDKEDAQQCGLYVAESTIPGAGIGIFTGIDLPEGSQVGYGDIVVPLFELGYHNGNPDNFSFPWDNYEWNLASLGPVLDETGGNPDLGHGAVPGFGAAINCRMGLNNVGEGLPEYDPAGLHRSKDPGAGAISPYHDRKNYVITDVPAGAELYANYGETWFEMQLGIFGVIPFDDNFQEANELLGTYDDLIITHGEDINEQMERDLWDLVIKALPFVSRTINAIPDSFEQIKFAVEVGTEKAQLPDSMRSLEWLQEHGKCMDNIRPGNSTIPGAGRGAFATRFIPKGGLVAPAPLLHIPERDVLTMYGDLYVKELGRTVRDTSTVIGHQLLLNYCFGHRNSTLLLSPYSATTFFINHSSKRPNAKIQWAENNTLNHRTHWLELSVDELKKEERAGLAFEYVAITDIFPGEEIFIDYGSEWEKAWDDHVKNWVPPEGSEFYIRRASELNKDMDVPLRTEMEQETQPYPDNVVLSCYAVFSTYGKAWTRLNWTVMFDTILKNSSEVHPCTIVSREVINNQTFYNATMHKDYHEGSRTYFLNQVPRDAFVFVDSPRPFTSDIFLRNAFRHEMMVPDEIFPKAWMNKG